MVLLPLTGEAAVYGAEELLGEGHDTITAPASDDDAAPPVTGADELAGVRGLLGEELRPIPGYEKAVEAALALKEPRPAAVPSQEQMVSETLTLMEQSAREPAA